VEKISDFWHGTVVLRLIRTVVCPPAVSILTERGVTSSSRSIFSDALPLRMVARTAGDGLVKECG